MEIIIIISGLLLILFIAYSFIITKQNHTQYNMVAMSEESIIKTSIKLVKTLRITTNGRGVTTNGLYSRISKCNKMLAKKNANNMVLNEAERWFFENYYLAFRGIFSQKNDLSGLPHCEGIPRLIILTRHIVGNSLSTLSIERVRKVFDNIKEHISLNYAEISNINFALNFAILEQIYILSNRLMFQEDCKKKAKKKKIDRNLLKYDSYCYYLFTLADLDMQQCDYLKKLGITFERVCLGHNQTIFDNAKMAQDLFGSLQRIEEFIPCKVGLEYIAPNNVFKTTPNYKLLSDNTLFAYCKIIEQISKKLNINEGYIAQKAKELAIENNMDISQIFYDYRKILIFYVKYGKIVQINKEKNYTKQRLYIASILSLTVISTIILFYFIGFYALLFSIPIIMFRIKLIDFLMAFNKKDKIVLSYNYSSVPSDAQTMVVICEYIDNLDQLSKSIRHAMIVKSNAKDDNIKVALLLDLKKSNSKTDAFDKEVSDYLRKYIFIEEINIFIRNRVKVGDKYQGYERKRGAIMSLNKMLITKNYDEFWYIQNKEELITPKFVVCMDADSMIMPDGISQMVNMFLHPYNDSKYDILSTINRYNLFSINNAYSKIFYKEGGIELYPNYAPFFYKRYGIGIFCGKGIYKLSSFYNKLEGIFPDNKILSHDILEGSILDCGVANVIFEDAPNSFLAENDRQSRWKKGDIQLLPFISGNWKNNKDEKINTKIDPLNKFLMVSNIINLTLPILIVITAVLGVLLQNKTLLITLGSMFVLPYLLDIVSIVRQIGNNVRIRHILADLLRCLRRLLLNIFMSLFDCVNNLGIIIKTLYNMIKGKNLLVWKPFFHIQSGKNTFVKYCALFCPSIVIGALLTIFSLLYSNIGIYLGAYVICSFIACVYLYILSQPQKKKELNNKDKEYLLSIAKKTYKYFEYMHIYDGMVADNLQIRPYKGDANKTSPTNIGFALLAEISAEKLGIISQDDCVENLIKILKSIKKLPKWYGNLYNWYDIEKKEPISKFVSSVDSGNFLCALLVTRAFFHQKKNYVGELTTQILINNTQINKLYDASKKLFYIGYDGDKFVSHYDLLNSESRLLSTIFVALYGQSEHLYSLKRDYSSLYGNTMMSWSGTAFEYLMPQLFINLPKYSGIEKTNKNVVKYQSKNLFLNLWGVSESGYAKLDSNQNYQYYAFGLKGLSLKNEENRGVISPYSSALALGYLDEKVVQNFRHLEWSNMLDEYGFFESYDTRNNSIIYSYMSHHQGMIICAICNNLGQNYLKDLFNFAPNVEGACQIYNEISSTVRFMPQTSKNTPNIINSDYKYYKNIDKIEYSNDTMALSDGKISLFTNLIGNTFIKYDNAIINKFVPIFEESSSGYFYVKNNKNEIYSPTYLPLKTEKNDYNYCYSNRSVLYENQAKKLSLDIALLPSLSGVVYRLKTNNQITKKVYFYMPITLCSTIDYLSHPAFYDLFVSAFVDDGILYITRKSRELNKKPLVMAVKLVGVKNIIWIANKAIFLGRNGKVEKPDYLYKDNKESSNLPYLGDILSPCVAFEAELKDNSNECQMLFIFGENYENVCEKVHSIDENMYLYAQNSHNNIVIDELTQSIMGDMLYSQYSKKTLQNIIKYNRTANFIQFCNSKKIIGYVFNEINIKELKTMIKVISDLTILRIEFNFVVFIEENEKNSNIDYINRILREDFVDNYQICKDEFYKEFCFILFDSNMSFTKNAYKINN
ncbi:MAG: glucoamylase family protein, partial [Clostridia bacterium]